MGMTRRAWTSACLALCAGSLGSVRVARAAEPELPVRRQVQLISKLASYDRNFKARAGDTARILIVFIEDDVDSLRTAEQVVSTLARRERVGGLPHAEVMRRFESAAALADEIREEKIAIAYICPGLEPQMPGIADALNGADVLTIGARAVLARLRAVVSFDVVSGKPKLIVNLPQAKRQNVNFSSRLLKLAQVLR